MFVLPPPLGIDFGGLFAVTLFLLYVFFIMLVLVNLLNGLAVADIGVIQKQAEVVAHVSREGGKGGGIGVDLECNAIQLALNTI